MSVMGKEMDGATMWVQLMHFLCRLSGVVSCCTTLDRALCVGGVRSGAGLVFRLRQHEKKLCMVPCA